MLVRYAVLCHAVLLAAACYCTEVVHCRLHLVLCRAAGW